MSTNPSYLLVDGIRIHCRSAGRGEPLVLVHGFLVSLRSWSLVAEQLGQRFAVHSIDLPGFGESDRPAHFSYTIQAYADTLSRALDALGLSRCTLIGHSMGGAIALVLAATYPERVERVVAVDAALYPFRLPLEGRLALLPVVGELLFRHLYSRRDMRRYFKREVYLDPALPSEETLQFYWERINRPGGRAAAYRCLQTLANLQLVKGFPGQVKCPVLVVWGEQDHTVPVEHGRRLVGELHRGKLVTIPGSGHAPMEERPDEFCEAVLPFLEEPPH